MKHFFLLNNFQVPPPVPKKPNVLHFPSSVHHSTNGNADRQTPEADSPVALQYAVAALSPEEFPCILSAPDLPEEDEHFLGTDEESSKESSLQSSLQDSSLTELEGKIASTGIGAGKFVEIRIPKLPNFHQLFNTVKEFSLLPIVSNLF